MEGPQPQGYKHSPVQPVPLETTCSLTLGVSRWASLVISALGSDSNEVCFKYYFSTVPNEEDTHIQLHTVNVWTGYILLR